MTTPKEAPLEVVVERGRVWIRRAHQSFRMDYDDPENLEWYADQLRKVLERGAQLYPVGAILEVALREAPEPWCRNVLLYSPNNKGDHPENRVTVYADIDKTTPFTTAEEAAYLRGKRAGYSEGFICGRDSVGEHIRAQEVELTDSQRTLLTSTATSIPGLEIVVDPTLPADVAILKYAAGKELSIINIGQDPAAGVNACSCGPKGHRPTNPLCPLNDTGRKSHEA